MTTSKGGRPALPVEHGTDRGYFQHRYRRDLPACVPCRTAHAAAEKRRAERREAVRADPMFMRLEDLRWMAEHGECAEGAAARLEVTPAALAKWCTVHGQTDLWHTLRARDPWPLDPHRQIQRLGWEAVA